MELNFNEDRVRPGTGDPTSQEELIPLLPRRRNRPTGLAGATDPGEPMADDRSPETVFDDGGPDSSARRNGAARRATR